jgi:hypothetical protein
LEVFLDRRSTVAYASPEGVDKEGMKGKIARDLYV